MKKNKKVAMILVILVASLSPVSPSNVFNKIFSQADVDSGGNITGTEIWDQDKTIDKEYIVKSGAELIIKKGVTIDFSQGDIIVDGKLLIEGTLDDPVKIEKTPNNQSSGGYTIEAANGGEIDMRNADVSGGGRQACLMRGNTVIDTAYACNITGAISSQTGVVRAENVSFHDNVVAMSVAGQYSAGSSGNIKVNRSEFINNSLYDVSVSALNSNSDFKYNWWGDASGPSQQCYTYNSQKYCYYDKTEGDFDFSNWRTQEAFHDPVIIVPGILGSWKWTDSGDWQMDPIFKTYDSLEKTFELNGYKEGKDLFTFPYQWRASNADTAKLLKQKIQEVKQATNWPKVDIVAHSMGGLVVRQYIESDDYQDDIDQIVLLGTPNEGAPEDYLVWENGDVSSKKFDIIGFLLNKIFDQEAHEAGFKNTFDYLHNEPLASVQELLPNYDYLYDTSSNKLRSYSNGDAYPRNSFLDNLNSPDNISKLDSVSITNIVGKQADNQTISEIKVGQSSGGEDSQWADGQPVDDGLVNGEGDGTVPLSSAEGISSDEKIEINAAHMNLPGAAQDAVYKTLTGNSPQSEVSYVPKNKMLFFFALSPIDIQIVSPTNKWIGKNINGLSEADKIDGAYYTGYDTANEFATIPNPEDGPYTVVTQGTGSGSYKVEVAKISEDENNLGQAAESTAAITGTASVGNIETATATVSGDQVTTGNEDTTPPQISIASPEDKTYKNNQTIDIAYSATDDQTASDQIQTGMSLDGGSISQNKIDLSLLSLGTHNLEISAQDEAGNQSSSKVNFEITTDVDAMLANLSHYFQLGLITNRGTQVSLSARLRGIKTEMKLLDALQNKKFPKWIKDPLVKNMQKNIDRQIADLENQIQRDKNFQKTIAAKVRGILVEGLESIMI